MLQSIPLIALLGIFAAAAAAVWLAGVKLADTTTALAQRFGFGEALGGVILLAIATNLPELAITASASVSGHIGVAVGNILGGIGIQTVVLVALDAFGMRDKEPLTTKAASLTLVIEGLLVIAVLTVAVMGTQLPASLLFARLTPAPVLITALWVGGVWLIGRANKGLPWQAATAPEPKGAGAAGDSTADAAKPAAVSKAGTVRTVVVFVIAAVVTLIAGVVLERAGDAIAGDIDMTGVLFGATVLAAATSLPELSTGLTATKAGNYQLAISDIFGGNAFLPVLFLLATLISGKAVLPQAKDTDIFLAGLAILLTTAYLVGLIFRPKRRVLGMGIDSLAVLIIYGAGTAGLFAIAVGGKHAGQG